MSNYSLNELSEFDRQIILIRVNCLLLILQKRPVTISDIENHLSKLPTHLHSLFIESYKEELLNQIE